MTEYIAEHLGYKEAAVSLDQGQQSLASPILRVALGQVPACVDPTWFHLPGSPLVAEAKYRLPFPILEARFEVSPSIASQAIAAGAL